MSTQKSVVIAMSGGVDSSVAAKLLVDQGYQVTGVMLRLWKEPGKQSTNRCCTPEAISLARRVSALIDIPFYVIDAQKIFYNTVVKYFFEGYAQGITPNPCLICNRYVRWQFLFEYAHALEADFLATGHYARLHHDETGSIQLLRGVDREKDQSYVLHMVTQKQLAGTILPLGGYTKSQVRELARMYQLPVADRHDSQDLCFISVGDYRKFLKSYNPQLIKPGPIVNTHGETMGKHQGLAFYTIGQRKGLGISYQLPLYVIEKDIKNNSLIVGKLEESGRSNLYAHDVNWISGITPSKPFAAQVNIRYRSHDVNALVIPLEDRHVQVSFDDPVRAITPGQAVVFYIQDQCLGGGIITHSQ